MDRHTMQVVYDEIDKRIDVLNERIATGTSQRVVDTEKHIVRMFKNLKEKLEELENEFLQEMAADYEAEEEARIEEQAMAEDYRHDAEYRMGLDRKEDDYDRY